MWVLIVIGFMYGSALGIRAEGVMTASYIRLKTERACNEARDKANEEFRKRERLGGVAFCVRDE